MTSNNRTGSMPDDDIARNVGCMLATVVGFAVPFVLGGVIIIVSICDGTMSMEIWGDFISWGMIAVLPAAVSAAIGSTVESFRRAGIYGVAIFLTVSMECLWYGGWWHAWSLRSSLWFVSLACGTGVMSAIAGWTIGVVSRRIHPTEK